MTTSTSLPLTLRARIYLALCDRSSTLAQRWLQLCQWAYDARASRCRAR